MDSSLVNRARLYRSNSFGGRSPGGLHSNESANDPVQSGDGDSEGDSVAAAPSLSSVHPAFQGMRGSANSKASESSFFKSHRIY